MVDWNDLLDEHGSLILRISWRILGNQADAEDNLQEVLVKAIQIEDRETVRHWRGLLRRLTTFSALEKLRRRRDHLALSDDSIADPGDSPEQLAIRQELKMRLRGALATLPRREGAVFSLRYFEELTLNEIAESLGISYAAAGTALSRARSKLHNIVSPTTTENDQ